MVFKILLFFLVNINLTSHDLELRLNDFELPEVKSDKSFLTNIALFSNETDIAANLIRNINNSQKTLDIAIYSITNIEITNAIINAYKRGIKVRMILEYSKAQTQKIDEAVKRLIESKIPVKILRGGGLYGVMHNKIIIIDSKILITGSYNFTLNANNNNFENIVISDRKNDIDEYKNYFEVMWENATDITDTSKSLITYNDIPTALLTSLNSIRTNIIKMIDYSQKSIDIAVYSISDDVIVNALLKAKNRGVKIRIVTDRLQSTQSKSVEDLYNYGFDIKISDGYNKGMMHNKYAIFDNSIVITGSFNWSNNAETYNWENAIVLYQGYAQHFIRNFTTIYNQAKPFDIKQENSSEDPISQ